MVSLGFWRWVLTLCVPCSTLRLLGMASAKRTPRCEYIKRRFPKTHSHTYESFLVNVCVRNKEGTLVPLSERFLSWWRCALRTPTLPLCQMHRNEEIRGYTGDSLRSMCCEALFFFLLFQIPHFFSFFLCFSRPITPGDRLACDRDT